MPLLENGAPVADRYVLAGDDTPDGPAIFALQRLLDEPGLLDRNQEIGVAVDGNTDLSALVPVLPRLALVAVRFPVFRDGRGFTLARTLRERFAYAGTLRATGHLLPDQYEFLLRCGFDQVETGADADLETWSAALTRFHTVSQPSIRGEPLLEGLRRRQSL